MYQNKSYFDSMILYVKECKVIMDVVCCVLFVWLGSCGASYLICQCFVRGVRRKSIGAIHGNYKLIMCAEASINFVYFSLFSLKMAKFHPNPNPSQMHQMFQM